MPTPSPHEVTQLLVAWRAGDRGAFDRLVPLVYRELHALAHARMRGQPDGLTIQTTALVHEAYVRLIHEQRIRLCIQTVQLLRHHPADQHRIIPRTEHPDRLTSHIAHQTAEIE